MVECWCFKCKKEVEVTNGAEKMGGNRRIYVGNCPVCNGKCSRMLPKLKKEEE